MMGPKRREDARSQTDNIYRPSEGLNAIEPRPLNPYLPDKLLGPLLIGILGITELGSIFGDGGLFSPYGDTQGLIPGDIPPELPPNLPPKGEDNSGSTGGSADGTWGGKEPSKDLFCIFSIYLRGLFGTDFTYGNPYWNRGFFLLGGAGGPIKNPHFGKEYESISEIYSYHLKKVRDDWESYKKLYKDNGWRFPYPEANPYVVSVEYLQCHPRYDQSGGGGGSFGGGGGSPPPSRKCEGTCMGCDCTTTADLFAQFIYQQQQKQDDLKDFIQKTALEQLEITKKMLSNIELTADYQPIIDRIAKAESTLWNGVKK